MRFDAEKNGGFTLVEVLIAMSILAVGILGIGGLASTAIRSSAYSQSITQANNLAQDRIEALMGVDFNNLHVTDIATPRTDLQRSCTQTDFTAARPVYSCTPTISTITLSKKDFTWSYTVTFIDLNNNGTANAIDGLKRLDIKISWMDSLWQNTRSVEVVTLRYRG